MQEIKKIFDLQGKIALITGSTSGMGKAIAEAMGAFGATVIVSSNDTKACEEVQQALASKGIKALAFPCDVADKEQINSLVAFVYTQCQRIDVLVSCVGIAQAGSLLEVNQQAFSQTMQLNLAQAMQLTQAVVPQMKHRREGVILYLASIAGVRGNKALGLYGMTKAALAQLARNVAVEFGPYNIRANAISPGMIDTPFSQTLLENKTFMEKRLALTPLRRVGTPEEIAGVAVMLASQAGGFITGQNIIVDGGTTISDGN